jgi:hypothetical protein
MTTVRRSAFVWLTALVVVAAAAPSQAAPLRSNRFQWLDSHVKCGVRPKKWEGISCVSESLPGKGKMVFLDWDSQAADVDFGLQDWRPGGPKPLRMGQPWRRAGVVCKNRDDVQITCVNERQSGFLISKNGFTYICGESPPLCPPRYIF